jgi:hypothetical protein
LTTTSAPPGASPRGVVAVAHEQDAVGQQDGFVHVVGDHEHGLLGLAHDAHQLVLDGAAGQRVERAEGLVQQQHLGLMRRRARCPRAASCRPTARGLLVDGRAQAHHLDELLRCTLTLAASSRASAT